MLTPATVSTPTTLRLQKEGLPPRVLELESVAVFYALRDHRQTFPVHHIRQRGVTWRSLCVWRVCAPRLAARRNQFVHLAHLLTAIFRDYA